MEKATNLDELMSVFRPTSLEGDDFSTFHVNTVKARGQDSARRLSRYFQSTKNEHQKVLFMGHRGSGKTTELWQVRKNLEAEFCIISFSIKDETDILDLTYTDLIFALMKNLLEKVNDLGIKLNPAIVDNLYDYWNNEQILEKVKLESYDINSESEAKISFLGALSSSVKGILKTGRETKTLIRKYIEPSLSHLINSINDIIYTIKAELKKQGKAPIIIIEDLDKLEIKIAEDLFLKHRYVLVSLNIHTIYTFPIFLRYSMKFDEIKESFDHFELLSMIKINNRDGTIYQDGRDILKQIIERRADLSLFQTNVLDYIIEKTGGAIRNIFEIINSAALTAEIDEGINTISENAAKAGYLELKSDFERKLSPAQMQPLAQLCKSIDKKPLQDESLIELLYSSSVIEYNGERWCDVHPAVADILRERQLI